MNSSIILIPVIVLLVSLKAIPAFASQQFNVVNQAKIEAKISKRDQNRISAVNDRISQVYSTNEKFHYDIDEGQGQIFIKPKSLSDESFTISIVTEKGKTIDLKLISQDIEAQTILLTLNETPEAEEVSFSDNEDDFELAAIVNSALVARDIDGFVKVELAGQNMLEEQDLKGFTENLKYRDGKRVVRVYSYKNLKPQKDILTEKQFYFSKNITAVFVENRELEPNQITRVVIVENEENENNTENKEQN